MHSSRNVSPFKFGTNFGFGPAFILDYALGHPGSAHEFRKANLQFEEVECSSDPVLSNSTGVLTPMQEVLDRFANVKTVGIESSPPLNPGAHPNSVSARATSERVEQRGCDRYQTSYHLPNGACFSVYPCVFEQRQVIVENRRRDISTGKLSQSQMIGNNVDAHVIQGSHPVPLHFPFTPVHDGPGTNGHVGCLPLSRLVANPSSYEVAAGYGTPPLGFTGPETQMDAAELVAPGVYYVPPIPGSAVPGYLYYGPDASHVSNPENRLDEVGHGPKGQHSNEYRHNIPFNVRRRSPLKAAEDEPTDTKPRSLDSDLDKKIDEMDTMLQKAMKELHGQSEVNIPRLCRMAAVEYANLYPQSLSQLSLDV